MAPRRGRLDTILLSDLFQSLAESQATGLLTVGYEEDSKRILLDHGQISISSAGMSEKVMLGDLLLARGLVSEEQIEKALEMQKTDRRRLGELLIQAGAVTQANIDAAIGFQVEEEILDLFTWRKGEFEFNEEVSDEDRQALTQSGTCFKIDTRKVIEQASKRAEEWRQLEQRITSPYLVFRPTEKSLAPAVQKEIGENPVKKRAFKWVQENRTVDTIVRKSCLGRIPLYQLLIGWIDERNIELAPVGELKFLASEHRSRHRYYDAMGIYRRLREAARTEAERRELEGAIADTKVAMEAQAASSAGLASASQTASLAHVKMARQQRRGRILQRALIYGSGALVLLGLIFYAAIRLSTDHTQEYETAMTDLDGVIRVQMESGQVTAARNSCKQVAERYPLLKERVDGKLQEIETEYRQQAEKKREEVRGQLGRLEVDDIKARLDQLAETFKDIPGYPEKIKKDHADLDHEMVLRQQILRSNSLKKWMLAAAVWQSQGNFGKARMAYFRATGLLADKDPAQARIDAQMKAMETVEGTQRDSLAVACDLDRAGEDLKGALAKYRAVAAMTPRMSWGAEAAARAGVLEQELAAATRQVKTVLDLPSSNDPSSSERQYRQAVIQLAPFGGMLEEIKKKLGTLVNRRLELDSLIRDAQKQDTDNRPDQARQKWADLLARYKDELVRRKLTVPYTIKTNPPGAQIVVGENLLGVTPLTFRLPADDTRVIEVRMQGFSTHRMSLDERRKLYADLVLSIDPVWSIRLTQGSCHGLLFSGTDLYVIAGGSLLALRPSAKTSIFDPLELLKLPLGDRKREAASSAGELMPPEWWALQEVPSFSASHESVWVPVQDCRLVRYGLNDQQTSEVRMQIEAATPLTLYKNPFVKNAEVGLFVGRDGLLYRVETSDTTQAPQTVSKLKYLPVPVQLAGEDTGYAVDDSGALVRLPIGDFDSAKAYPLDAPITGGFQIVKVPGAGGAEPSYFALAVETDGALELVELADMSRKWTQPATAFSVRTVRLVGDGELFLQTGLAQGRAVLECRKTAGAPTGAPVWSVALDGTALKPCVSTSTVYVASDDKTLHAYSLKDGKVLWSSAIPGLPEYMEALPDGTVALEVKQGQDRSVLIYKVENSDETPAP